MSSRLVLVAVPPGWGRSTVLDKLTEAVGRDDAPVALVVQVNGRELPDGVEMQAAVLRECLAGAATRHKVAELLGVDRLGGVTQLGLGVGGLFVSGLAEAVSFLVSFLARRNGFALFRCGAGWPGRGARR